MFQYTSISYKVFLSLITRAEEHSNNKYPLWYFILFQRTGIKFVMKVSEDQRAKNFLESCSYRVSIFLAVLKLLHGLNHSCHAFDCPCPCAPVRVSLGSWGDPKCNDRLKRKVLWLFGYVGLPTVNKEVLTVTLTPCISMGLNYFWWSQWWREKIWFLLWSIFLFLPQKDFKVWLKK